MTIDTKIINFLSNIKPNIILNINYFENNSIRNIVKVLSLNLESLEDGNINLRYIDVYGNKNNYNINETNIDKIEFIDDENWYGRDFLFSDFMRSLEKVSDNQKNENKHPYACCDSDEHDVKIISAHGCIFNPFVLPQGVKLITMGYLGCLLYDTYNNLISRKISEFYENGNTIFANNDNNPDIINKETKSFLDNVFKKTNVSYFYSPYAFKLNLQGELVNNYILHFGDKCNTKPNYDNPSMFCNIICINKSDGKYKNECVNHVKFLKNETKEISLSDLIKINGKGTYIVSACRGFCSGFSESNKLSKTISSKKKRYAIIKDKELEEFFNNSDKDTLQLYFNLINKSGNHYNNIQKIIDYLNDGDNDYLKLILEKELENILLGNDKYFSESIRDHSYNIFKNAIINGNVEMIKLLLNYDNDRFIDKNEFLELTKKYIKYYSINKKHEKTEALNEIYKLIENKKFPTFKFKIMYEPSAPPLDDI